LSKGARDFSFTAGNWDVASNQPVDSTQGNFQGHLVTEQKNSRSIFVAYPYDFSQDDYRGAFAEVGQEFEVEFTYADEQITNRQILDKVTEMIQMAGFGIFDITTWNPNVALELGISLGLKEDYYVLFDPTKGQTTIPTDLGGIDRLEYEDYSSLKEGLRRLLEQQFGAPGDPDRSGSTGDDFNTLIEQLRVEALEVVAEEPGIQIGGIAAKLAVDIAYARIIARPLVGDSLETRGARRGTRYYRPDDLPEEPEVEHAPAAERDAEEKPEP
jgi:hypothetical protein